LALGTIEINKNLTISGNGASNTIINGNHQSTVFQIDSGVSVSIVGVTVENGTACTSFSCNGNGGGGIRNAGTTSLINSVVSGNSTGCNCNAGGGVLNTGALTVTQSTFSGNGAAYGGAIGNNGTLTVFDSTFSGNGAAYGGGVFNWGAGSVSFSTFYHNASTFAAPGINGGGSLTLKGVLFGNNNLVDGVGNPYAPGSCTAVVSAGYNLADDSSCGDSLNQPTDLNNTLAGLDTAGLKNNGGPTPTVALIVGSAAVDAVPISPTNYCTDAAGISVVSDQRGMARPQGFGCDIGAFELAADNDSAFAQLVGGNNLSGNQNVSGTVSATAFVGDGSGLTGVIAANANIANLANYATSAGDAATLGGFSASAFAPATGSPSYVAKAGDAMTGTLNLPANGLIAGGSQLVLSGGNVGIGTATPEAFPGYTSLHIDNAGAGFGGAFLELTHSPTGAKGRVVMDDHGFLLHALNLAPVKIKSGNFNGGGDPGHIYVSTSGNVGIGTGTPAATLDVNGTANFSGLVTFASGQTFPGVGNGTITGVAAGAGLSGGGTSGNVSLTNTGILSLSAGSGLNSTSGQTPTLSLNTSFTDGRYAQLGAANTFTATQTVPNLTVSGTVSSSFGNFSANTSTQVLTVNQSGSGAGLVASASNSAGAAVSGTGGYFGLYGSGTEAGVKGESYLNFGVVGTSVKNAAIFGIGGPYGLVASGNTAGVWGQGSGTGTGLYGSNTSSTGTAGTFSVTSNGKILSGQNNATEVFSVAGNGNVNTSGTLATVGSVTIGSGTPITRHISMLFQNVTFNAKLSPGTCTVWPGTVSGAADGDTVAVGMGSSLMSANIVYSAWATSGGVQVRICNPTGAPTTVGAGNIRIDVWKH
jgi:hypothetical protein